MSLIDKAKMRNYGDKNFMSELSSSSSNNSASQKRDDSSNSSLEQSDQCFSEGTSNQYYTGIVKSFNSKEGYGFIACGELMQEYGCDVFMHKKQFFSATVSLRIGDNVRFRLEFSKQGKPQARQLSRVAETPVAVLRRLSKRPHKIEPEQVTVLQPELINQKRKRKVSFKEVVEVCEDKIVGDEEIANKQHARTSPRVAMKKKHIKVSPAKKFSSLLTWKEAKQNSCPRKIFTGEKKIGTCPVDSDKTPPMHEDVTPNRTTDHDVTEEQILGKSPVEPNKSKKTQTRQLVSPRLEKRVISIGETPQTSELKEQGDKKTGETAQSRLEEGVINGLLRKTVKKEAVSIISKKDSKKGSNRKRVTFRLAEEIIDDSDSGWSSGRTVRQSKKRTGMMRNFGATVRRNVKNSIGTGGSKGIECSRSEGELELEQEKEKELARLASETYEKLQRVQNKSKTSKLTLPPKLKSPKKILGSNNDPAYLDWSLGFGQEESSAQSESKRKGQHDESPCKNNNVQVQEKCSIQDGEKKLDSVTQRKRNDWFSKPPDCRIPKVPPRKDSGPRAVLTEAQVRGSQPTRGRFTGFNGRYSSRRDDQEQCSNEFETCQEELRCNRKMAGQILNRQQSQPIQSRCEEEKKTVEDHSMVVKLLERELPLRNYKFPRPLDRRKQRK